MPGDSHRDGSPASTLAQSVNGLHDLVTDLRFPLDLPGADTMRNEQARVLRLLESYALPRLNSDADAPLVVVIGGATGAGKSTLTNSLVGREASPSGIIRPTTRQPVLVYHPTDGPALHALGLFRAQSQSGGADATRWIQLRSMPSEDLPPGLTIIDSPDLDSRVEGNRELAARLLDIADLWLFVTTGTDYADAMSWDLLAQAAERRVSIAVVLNRLRPTEFEPVRNHFAGLLTEAGLADAHVFTLPETGLIDGKIPLSSTGPLSRWLARRAGDQPGRQLMVDQAFGGTLDETIAGAQELAHGVSAQLSAANRLHADLVAAFSDSRELARQEVGQAALAQEELITAWRAVNTRTTVGPDGRWQPIAAHAAPTTTSTGLFRRRQRSTQPSTNEHYLAIGRSLNAALTEVLRVRVAHALRQVSERWEPLRIMPLDGGDSSGDVPSEFNDRVASATLSWLTSVQRRLRAAGMAPAASVHPTVDPLPLALASLAAEGRPGRNQDLDAEAANRAARLREQLEIPLADLLNNRNLAPLLRDAWLDLLNVMHSVLAQDEARLTAKLTTLQLAPDLPDRLLATAHAIQVTRGDRRITADASLESPDGDEPPDEDHRTHGLVPELPTPSAPSPHSGSIIRPHPTARPTTPSPQSGPNDRQIDLTRQGEPGSYAPAELG